MNMMGLLLNQAKPNLVTNLNSNGTQLDGETNSSIFHQLLSTEQSSNEMLLNAELPHAELVNLEELLASLGDMPLDMLKELYRLLVGNTELVDELSQTNELSGDEMIGNLVTLIHELVDEQGELAIPLWSQLKTEFQIGQQPNNEKLVTHFVNPSLDGQVKITQPDQEVIQKQFNEIFAQVEALLSKVTNEQDLIKISPRIMELLEKWTALMNKYGSEMGRNATLPTATLTESTADAKALNVWNELVSTFQKRNELASNQHYQTNAKVTTKDIAKWLQSNLNAQVHVVENVNMNTQTVNLSNQPISKVEQYVIHMNQSETAQPADKQLIDQFQQVMRTSRFLSMNNGVNQLSIALRPDNLGEMMVRFTEINGEMTLKIIVTSQASRQMLEANIHQLKNMFSPHQVVIEEREAIIENVQTKQEEQPLDEQEEEHSQESTKDESQNFDGDFETQFQEILMNEKV